MTPTERAPSVRFFLARVAGGAVLALTMSLTACSIAPGDVAETPESPVSGVLAHDAATVTAQVTSANGDVCEMCLWVADEHASHRRGLAGVTDLGGKSGMAFVFEQPQTANFHMFNTPTPLSIAWFNSDGFYIADATMEPCIVDDKATCERYSPDKPYLVAVEVLSGHLERNGIGPGSRIELLGGPCA